MKFIESQIIVSSNEDMNVIMCSQKCPL